MNRGKNEPADRATNFSPKVARKYQEPFWIDPSEPRISTATKTLTKEQTRLFYTTQNLAYSLVLEESIWGKALSKVVVDGIFPEQAAHEAIKQIKQIFAQWQ